MPRKHSVLSTLAAPTLVLALAFTLALNAGTAAAQPSWPAKPVRVLVGFAAGGVADITARVVAQKLSERLGQQFLVENRPSAGGIVAAEAVAKSEPDGHTLLLISNGNAVSVSLFNKLPYDPVRDFEPVSTIGFFAIGLAVKADSKLGSVRDLLGEAKSNPGKLNVGTIAIGSTQHLSAELFRSMSGAEFTVVPFKGTPAVTTALLGGEIQVSFEILAPLMPQVKSGALKLIAVSSERRFAGLPNVPTVAESGVAGYNVASWNGFAAPRGTPAAVVDRLSKEMAAVLALPDVRQRFQDLAVEPRASTPAELRTLLGNEISKWRAVVERAKIEKQ